MPNELSGWVAMEKDDVWDVLCDKYGDGTLYSVLEYTTEEQAKLIAQAPTLQAELQQAREEIEKLKACSDICEHVDCNTVNFLAAEREGEMSDDWHPIETAPKDGTYILLGWFLDGGGGPPEVAFWDSTRKTWCSSRLLKAEGYFSPTHWMPLPERPKDDD